ncbi:MAG: MFS transporter [Litorivicinaceae bacterium]|jgi:predicted MFS family arabinose efflux permease|nr:MFS transporter [Litorivicinaceae bacterium]MDP5329707.1 MFS transporter [Litorivicinaceae bacterium]MDP5331161.1 MFS transporter [Litorivicinaceae bacterium]MDP5340895.1 MFS transporter [Litorivicinaceae bacterium]MDP5342927.1 MFS transporter [Litorivicinaceae bacterium]
MFGLSRFELKITLLVLGIQFVTIVDFMMIMPLGPDFARELGLRLDALGLITAAYVFSAATVSFMSARYMDILPRKRALACCLAGLLCIAVITPSLGESYGLTGLLVGRALAGMFGGPATGLAMTILTDAIAPEKRGRAVGLAGAAFSVAAIAGVPLGLELARIGGWQLPFYSVAVASGLAMLATLLFIPNHLQTRRNGRWQGTWTFLARKKTAVAYLIVGITPIASFLFIPNMFTYFQMNLGYPRELIGLLYAIGGTCTLMSMQIAGWNADRFGIARASVVVSLGSVISAIVLFGFDPLIAPLMVLFPIMMVFNSARSVVAHTGSSLVPVPEERGAHMAFQVTVRHLGTGIGAVMGAWILSTGPTGALEHIEWLLAAYILIVASQPLIMWWLERSIKSESLAPADVV